MRYLISAFGSVAAIAMALACTPVLAQTDAESFESIVEYQALMYSAPDVYYFFEDDSKQILDYKTDRIVRICTGESRHLVPLKVTYDGSSAMIEAGDCIRVEARKVSLEPAKRLDTNAVIRAEVQTMN